MRRVSKQANGEQKAARRGWPLWPLLIALAAWGAAAPSSAAGNDNLTPDIYVRTLLARDELELIRLEMGRPKDERRELRVVDAEPREVFFQAMTLFYLVNRLSFDLTRTRVEPPEKPVGTPRPAHVMAVVDAVLEQLWRVKATLGSIESSREQPRDDNVTPSDIFRVMAQAARQVDLLLDQRIAPRDVFQQVTLAVGYAAQLRTRFPGTRLPEPPPFERRKRPADVYRRLIACYAQLRAIMTHSGFSVLRLDQHPEEAAPSDVYNIASLIVFELSYLHTQVDGVLPPPAPYDPGRKLPSDVYQRAGLLEMLLIDLQALTQKSPAWLNARDERE